MKHEVGEATQELRSEIVALKEEYDSLAFGKLKADIGIMEKTNLANDTEIRDKISRLNDNAARDKSMLSVRIKQLDDRVSGIQSAEERVDILEEELKKHRDHYDELMPKLVEDVKQLRREHNEFSKFREDFEKRIEVLGEKATSIQNRLPDVVEEIIAAGNFTFVSSAETHCTTSSSDDRQNSRNDGQEEQVYIASTPVDKRQQTTPESEQQLGDISPIVIPCRNKRPLEECRSATKKLKQKWSWKKQNPGGLSFLEAKCQSPNFSRTSDFKDAVYAEGIERGLWTKSTDSYLKVCTKIDNLHKSMIKHA